MLGLDGRRAMGEKAREVYGQKARAVCVWVWFLLLRWLPLFRVVSKKHQ